MMISNKYEVLAEIGRGGMGIVYKVRHVTLETVSALKILPSHLSSDQELVARFHREARVMAQLRHPNIVRVIDVDKSGELDYFVMELIDGQSLSHVIVHQGPRPLEETLDLAIQVAAALSYAHGRNPRVIHRDIKPANILIEDETRRAVVTDFGLAKLAGGPESILTESGKFIGTLRYCAPEQLLGNPQIDARVDVYALGMVIYEAYVGRAAYVDLQKPQIIAGLMSLTGEHPFQFPPGTPDDLRELILRATAKDRDHRYATVAEMLADLELLKSGASPTERGAAVGMSAGASTARLPKPVPSRVGARTIALGAAASLGLAFGVGLFLHERQSGPPDDPPSSTGKSAAAPSPAGGSQGAAAEEETARKFISVMDFTPGSPDPSIAWMRDAIRDNLNSRLSTSPDCKVFSKDFIDFKAQQMVREGQYHDVKVATMEVAEKLGVTKAVLGSYRADRDSLHIEAHLVDMRTGVQEASETVEGAQDDFAKLQASLAKKLMLRLGVAPPPPEAAAVQAAESGTDLDTYRLLLEAEGQAPMPEPSPAAPRPGKKEDRRGDAPRNENAPARIVAWLTRALEPASAAAVDAPDAPSSPESEIRETLERYRRACESKDLALLSEVYEDLSPAQVDANRRYFENARNLQVSIEEIDVALGGDKAAVSYTRKDRFIDNETERPAKVEVRLTKILVKVNGTWKIQSDPTRK